MKVFKMSDHQEPFRTLILLEKDKNGKKESKDEILTHFIRVLLVSPRPFEERDSLLNLKEGNDS